MQEAAQEKLIETELDVSQEEAVGIIVGRNCRPRRLEGHLRSNTDPFLERRFQKMIERGAVCYKCGQKGHWLSYDVALIYLDSIIDLTTLLEIFCNVRKTFFTDSVKVD